MIRDFAGDGTAFGLTVRYSFDGPKLLGTAGAIRQALPLLSQIVLCPLRGFVPAMQLSRRCRIVHTVP
jgi:hypothetical protein